MMFVVSEKAHIDSAATGLVISFAGDVHAGECFGGAVCGWNAADSVLTIRTAAEETVWKIVRIFADLCVTVTARLREFAERCRAKFRRTLFRRVKPRAAVLASCLVMRR